MRPVIEEDCAPPASACCSCLSAPQGPWAPRLDTRAQRSEGRPGDSVEEAWAGGLSDRGHTLRPGPHLSAVKREGQNLLQGREPSLGGIAPVSRCFSRRKVPRDQAHKCRLAPPGRRALQPAPSGANPLPQASPAQHTPFGSCKPGISGGEGSVRVCTLPLLPVSASV